MTCGTYMSVCTKKSPSDLLPPPVHLVILGHGTQLPPPAEGEVKTAGGAEPILRQPGCQLYLALTAAS